MLDLYKFCPGLSLKDACYGFNTMPKKKAEYVQDLLTLTDVWNENSDGLESHMVDKELENLKKYTQQMQA